MRSKPTISIEECKPKAGETYGAQCDRMEEIVKLIVESGDNTENAISTLAHIMMEAPADFGSDLFKSAKIFISTQSEEMQKLFKVKCEEHARRHNSRIAYLLSRDS